MIKFYYVLWAYHTTDKMFVQPHSKNTLFLYCCCYYYCCCCCTTATTTILLLLLCCVIELVHLPISVNIWIWWITRSFNLLWGCWYWCVNTGSAVVNKGDAKCKCAMRNVSFVSELIRFQVHFFIHLLFASIFTFRIEGLVNPTSNGLRRYLRVHAVP